MASVDIWFWIVTLVLAALIAMINVGARRSRSRVDPTDVTIDPALAARVRSLTAKGDRLKAVKELREATGLGLGDAVRIVEKMTPAKKDGSAGKDGSAAKGGAVDKGGPPMVDGVSADRNGVLADIGPDHLDELRELVGSGQQIQAIKMVRELTGMGLSEAKDFVERL